MKNKLWKTLLTTSLLCIGTAHAQLFDEAANGDASNDAAAPTVLNLSSGSNLVSGSVTRSNDIVAGDIDFFTFTITDGEMLEGIFLTAYDPPNDRGFHAINTGPTGIVPSGPNAGDPSEYLGATHLSFVGADTNLLDDFATPLAGQGVEGPLGPGTYSYIIQQTGPVVSTYTLDFTVVPEPASGSVAYLLGCILAASRLRRRR